MSKEVREAAQRVIKHLGDSLNSGATVGDMHDVCRAWLAEHPEDSDEAVTAEWLNATDLKLLEFGDWAIADNIKIAECMDGKYRAIIGDSSIELVMATRGDVRRLARALRVELGEKR